MTTGNGTDTHDGPAGTGGDDTLRVLGRDKELQARLDAEPGDAAPATRVLEVHEV
ncbi:hypothetical protein ACSNN9_26955 [Micromonospora sp. URMC 107]|uniref:hypothetical protein n=1 Tax=Micromonospora sp. URMC 107 TaxID=3423418 RepID=UPI003F1DFCDE